jgi:polyisoprenoid-binding protein YceI
MKNLIKILSVIISLSITSQAQTVYKVNTNKTKLSWTGYASVGNYAPTGTLNVGVGNLILNGKNVQKAQIEFDMKTISHENKDLQNHLRNEDFFDVEKYPKAIFILQKVANNQVIGLLKIKNIQQKISFPITMNMVDNEVNIKGSINIDRTAFGIKYNSTNFFQNLGDYAIKDNFRLEIDLWADQTIK